MNSGLFKSSTPIVLNVVVLVFALMVLCAFGVRTIVSGDVWTHLVSGQLMAEKGGVPHTDQSSFSRADAEMVVPTWLYDKIIYKVWKTMGPNGVTLMHLGIVLMTFLVMLPLARKWCNFPSVSLGIILSAWLLSFKFSVTPSLAVLIFPAIFLVLLNGNTRSVYLWTLIPLCQWLWVNMYSSFLIGPLLCLLMAVQAFFSSDDDEDVVYAPKIYLGLALFCIGVTFINPYGFELHKHVVAQWDSALLSYVSVWISPFAGQFKSGLSSILLVLTLIVGACGLVTFHRKLPLMLTIIVALVAFMAVRSIQYVEILAILAFPFICLTIQASLVVLDDVVKNLSGGKKIVEYLASALVIALSVFSLHNIVSNRYYNKTGSAASFGLGVDESALPAAAAIIIGDPAFPERALNMPIDGGYLSWRFPERKIFVDSRAVLYGKDFFEKMESALQGDDEAWRSVIDENKIDAVIIPCSSGNGGKIVASIKRKKDWKLVYFDGTTAVFIRDLERYAGLIGNSEIQTVGLNLMDKFRIDYIESLESGRVPVNSSRLIGAGNVFYALGHLSRACAVFDLFTKGAPNMTGAWLISGISRSQLGVETENAIYMLERACRENPDMPLAWLFLSNNYHLIGDTDKSLRAYENAAALDAEMTSKFGRPGEKKNE